MKKISSYMIAAAAALFVLGSCAKTESSANYASAKMYLEAWMHVHYPDQEPNEDGIYILDDTPGTGDEVDDSAFVFVTYTKRTLDGTVSETSEVKWAQQLGTYEKANWYGDHAWYKDDDALEAGLESAFSGMRIGGERTVIIPRWLMTTSRYDTLDEYVAASSGSDDDYIYTLKVNDATDSIYRYEIAHIDEYVAEHYAGKEVDDTTYGFRYIQLKAPTDTTSFPSDTTIYINYIGRLLNGQVFDTTIADTAKMYNIYDSGNTYEPVLINWGEESDDLTMTSSESSVITGFSNTLWKMRAYEKGVGIFYSYMGYSSSGSGETIPEYAPLIFEIEIVDEPDDD